MAELTPQDRRYKRDQILTSIGQLLHRQTKLQIATPLDVAKLAIEIARLRKKTDAKSHADEAVALLRESHVALERPAPDVKTPKQLEAMVTGIIEKNLEAGYVPYAQLVRLKGEKPSKARFTIEGSDGEPREFEPYTSERGFKDLLVEYAALHYEKHREHLLRLLIGENANTQIAIAFLKRFTNGECAADIAVVEKGFSSQNEAETFAVEWAKRATGNFVNYLRSAARTGNLDSATVCALLRLRIAKVTHRNQQPRKRRTKARQ